MFFRIFFKKYFETSNNPTSINMFEITQAFKELKQMRNDGILSEKEYRKAKKKTYKEIVKKHLATGVFYFYILTNFCVISSL